MSEHRSQTLPPINIVERDLRHVSQEEIYRLERQLKNLDAQLKTLKPQLEAMATNIELAYEDFIDVHLQYIAAVKEESELKARFNAILEAKKQQHEEQLERRRTLRKLECANLSKLQILSRMSLGGQVLDRNEHQRWMRSTRDELISAYIAEIE